MLADRKVLGRFQHRYGVYTMLLAQWVGPSGAVFAFEPAPAAYAGLVEHVRLNRLGASVRSVRTAIADATSNVLFKVAGTAGKAASRSPPIEPTRRRRCR